MMLALDIDTHSSAYQSGQILGGALAMSVPVVLVWVLTRRWRNPVAQIPEDLPRVTALRKKRRIFLVLALLAACALYTTKVVLDFHNDHSPYGPAAETRPLNRTVEAPDTVAPYHLVTGDAPAQLTAKANAGAQPGRFWFYSLTPWGIRPNVVLSVTTSRENPREAAETAAHSMDWLFLNFFAGAKVDDPQDVDAGPLGGLMRCGATKANGTVMCHWEDAATAGTLVAGGVTDIRQAGAITLRFRNAVEH